VIEYRQGGNNYGNNFVTIYTECSYRGNSLKLSKGSYPGTELGMFRFNISSIELPSNLRMKVYVNNEYLGGTYYVVDESSSCLNSNLNNRIGSFIIEEKGYGGNNNNYPPGADERVIIYSDENFRGVSVSLLPGTYYKMSDIGFPDKSLSSLKVPAGYTVIIYDQENLGGKSYTITQTKNKFYLSNWNDKTSSIAIYRNR
jgi:hypothetical protein